MGQWSDLPRRLLTVSIGAPFIVLMLANPISSHIFFQAVHLCCVLEWLQLNPADKLSTLLSKILADTDGDIMLPPRGETRSSIHYKKCNSLKLFPMVSLLAVYVPSCCIAVYTLIIVSCIFLLSYLDMECVSQRDRIVIQSSVAHIIHGLLFLSIPFHYWVRLSQSSFSHTIFLLFTVWNTDTGALISGRVGKMCFNSHDVMGDLFATCVIGRRFVGAIKRISPSKSITGFCGGILLGTMTACYLPNVMVQMFRRDGMVVYEADWIFFGNFVHIDVNLVETSSSADYGVGILDFDKIQCIGAISLRRILLGAILSCFAIAGDLVESCVKRNAGKKDSGKLLPGHGGILDRFDSTFLAVPIYFMFINDL
mmetsp:Transcript_4263/g.8159  ORF Transcript_4263/g.8159 Transcript_4263/m.8159 type:complete len:368 (-) Transcript_4263:112-1215(-)